MEIPEKLTSSQIRQKFLDFFRNREHAVIPSASLVTPDEKGTTDQTLFNTAGMQPLVPYLLGQPHPAGKRLVNVQKVIRTVDIDDIGDNTHATFFEMLGNWSLGDYFKKEAINWSYEFLTSKDEGLGLDPLRLYVTVFEGDANAPKDDEAADLWKEVFKKNTIEGQRIFYMPASMNWWEAGANGPAGPDTEMYYDVRNKFEGKGITREQFLEADSKRDIVEIWNDVFMQYEKKDGKIIGPLPKPSVDTGAGLERLTMTLQEVDNIYDTDLLKPVMNLMAKANNSERNKRVIADHLKASIFLIADGVMPSNTDRGYILRRLIRRAVISTTDKKLDAPRIKVFTDSIVNIYREAYPELEKQSENIKGVLLEETEKFAAALDSGMREFERLTKSGTISGNDAFMLFSSHGLPIDVIKELSIERGLSLDTTGFEVEFKRHQDLSRSGAEKKFKGGLADTSEMSVRYHTATHLLHQALHDVLGEGVMQKGSNITPDRLRFDFAHGAKMTDEEKKKVEEIVNGKIVAALPMQHVTMPKSDAEKTGARHFFGEKYGEEISIYFIGNDLQSAYSKEFCGGPHVKNTSELAGPEGKWKFKISKEEAVSQGVRRIKAVLE